MTVSLRLATMADRDDLLRWRNDDATCRASRSTAKVSDADHDRWMKSHVVRGFPDHLVLIAEPSRVIAKLGVIRLDRNSWMAWYEVSITVAPEHRGNGVGTSMLKAVCDFSGHHTLKARIRMENSASRNIFGRCGFLVEAGGSQDWPGNYNSGIIQYRREGQK